MEEWNNLEGATQLALTKYSRKQFPRVSLTKFGIFFAMATSKKPLSRFYSTRLHESFATFYLT